MTPGTLSSVYHKLWMLSIVFLCFFLLHGVLTFYDRCAIVILKTGDFMKDILIDVAMHSLVIGLLGFYLGVLILGASVPLYLVYWLFFV